MTKEIKDNPKPKQIYYQTTIYCCVQCGKETKNRKRVFDRKESGIAWYDDLCWEHKI